MPELELTRTPADRRAYALEGVGTLRLKGWASRTATAEAGGTTWRFARRGLLRSAIEATDVAGTPVGSFAPERWRRGGALAWAERELALRPASRWRERYALVEGPVELAVFDAKSWGRRPVTVSVEDPAGLDPALLLFAAFVVHGLAEDTGAGAAAAGGAGAVAAG